METQKSNIPWTRYIILFISGILIGGGAILPGISGGVLAVIFGIYKPLMELLAHPIKTAPKYWKMLLPVGIGWLVGFFLFAKVIELIFGANQLLGTWLFIGLIAGEIPSLFKEAGEKGRTKGCYVAMIVSFVITFGILLSLKLGIATTVEPNTFWYVFAGVLWGLSLIIPGMSSSSTLMALGLYVPVMTEVANFNFKVIVLWLAGLVGTVLLLAKLVNHLFQKHYGIMYHIVVGVTVASTLVIIPLEFKSIWMLLLSLLCCAVGVFIALWMSKMDPGDAVEKEAEQKQIYE